MWSRLSGVRYQMPLNRLHAKIRPGEHVRDDAGRSSGAITDKYIDIELRERHSTAKHKRIKPEFIEEN